MPYVKTGKPPGRPRKVQPEVAPPKPVEPAKPLTRAREGFRRAFENPADALHHPPRRIKREIGRRAILHPNVIKG